MAQPTLTYVVYEIQADGAGGASHLPPIDKATENEAWSEFYLKCAYAATSTVPIHTVILAMVDGRVLQVKSFAHKEVNAE